MLIGLLSKCLPMPDLFRSIISDVRLLDYIQGVHIYKQHVKKKSSLEKYIFQEKVLGIYIKCLNLDYKQNNIHMLLAKWIRQADPFRLAKISPAEWNQG